MWTTLAKNIFLMLFSQIQFSVHVEGNGKVRREENNGPHGRPESSVFLS